MGAGKASAPIGAVQSLMIRAIGSEMMDQFRSVPIRHPDIPLAAVANFIHGDPRRAIGLGFVGRMPRPGKRLENLSFQRAFFDIPGEFVGYPEHLAAILLGQRQSMGTGILPPPIQQLAGGIETKNRWNRLANDKDIPGAGAGNAVGPALTGRLIRNWNPRPTFNPVLIHVELGRVQLRCAGDAHSFRCLASVSAAVA